MPRTGRLIIESGVFHILCRGNNRQRIFEKDSDYRYYLDLLKNYKADHKFFLYHYCLMPNHAHLLLETTVDTDLPKLMKQLNLSYYFYFRKRYKYYGHFWQGRYKSLLVSKDEYMLMCGRYIENNPIKAGLVRKGEDYQWSSYKTYAGGIYDGLVDSDPLYEGLGREDETRQKRYREFLKDGVKINFNSRFLGGERFIKAMEKRFGVKNIELGPGRPKKADEK